MPPPAVPTVFIVDDDEAVRKAVSRLLRSAGIAVAVFASPREFLAQYDPATPGCLVLDLVCRLLLEKKNSLRRVPNTDRKSTRLNSSQQKRPFAHLSLNTRSARYRR